MSREALERVAGKLSAMDEETYFRIIDQANIQVMLVDVLGWLTGRLESFLDGKKTFPEKWRLMISLPNFHPVYFNGQTVQTIGQLANQSITSLDEFLEAVFTVFQRCIERGIVGIIDQSAYERIISYDLVPKAEAEKQFNRVLADPRNELGWPEGKPLNDYLFHHIYAFRPSTRPACSAAYRAHGRDLQPGG